MSSLGERLAIRRRRCFVGRVAEQELFRTALNTIEPPFAVLHVHGPGGIGKTSLIERFAALAAGARRVVVRLDGRELAASPDALLAALGMRADLHDEDVPLRSERPFVLLLDSYERFEALDDWFRTRLLPRFPVGTLTVLASRLPPSAGWRADPGWHDLLRVVALRNLDPDDQRAYLNAHGVPPAHHERLLAASHGHPLGLSLLADLSARGDDGVIDSLTPDLVSLLLRRFVDTVPSGPERRALEVCALARATNESLLRNVLGDENAHELFRSLLAMSFVESGPDGAYPHDLARDVLAADLRWRDPETHRSVFRTLAAHVRKRLFSTEGAAQRSAIHDLKFLFRDLPGILSPIDWDAWGRHEPEPARASDRAAVVQLVASNEGEPSAALAEHWWARQPEGFFVLRDGRGLRGLIALLDLSAASEEDRAVDPGVQAAWDHARRSAPARAGERITQTRFVIDRDAYQAPSPTINVAPVITLQRYLAMPNLAWDYLTLFEPEIFEEYFALADLPRARGADFVVAGRRYGLFAHDFRAVPVRALVELWTERALAEEVVVAPALNSTSPLVLSHSEFTDAVRQALRDLGDPQALSKNPLQRARLVRDRSPGDAPDPAVLARLIGEAIADLGCEARDAKRVAAVDRTYVHPAPTQEAAAERLGLPFSTYRRHLSQGVERIVAWLWERELHGFESQ